MVVRREVPMRRKWSWGRRTSDVIFLRIGTSCRTSGGRSISEVGDGHPTRGADAEKMVVGLSDVQGRFFPHRHLLSDVGVGWSKKWQSP